MQILIDEYFHIFIHHKIDHILTIYSFENVNFLHFSDNHNQLSARNIHTITAFFYQEWNINKKYKTYMYVCRFDISYFTHEMRQKWLSVLYVSRKSKNASGVVDGCCATGRRAQNSLYILCCASERMLRKCNAHEQMCRAV